MNWNIFWRAGKVTKEIWKPGGKEACDVEICAELYLSSDEQYKTGGSKGGSRTYVHSWQSRLLQRQRRRESCLPGHMENPLWMSGHS